MQAFQTSKMLLCANAVDLHSLLCRTDKLPQKACNIKQMLKTVAEINNACAGSQCYQRPVVQHGSVCDH